MLNDFRRSPVKVICHNIDNKNLQSLPRTLMDLIYYTAQTLCYSEGRKEGYVCDFWGGGVGANLHRTLLLTSRSLQLVFVMKPSAVHSMLLSLGIFNS